MADELLVRAAIRDELSGPLADIREELRELGGQAEKAGRKANLGARGFDRMAAGVGGLARVGGRTLVTGLRAGTMAIGAMIAAATVGSAKLLAMASDAAETGSAFSTVFAGVAGDVGGYLDDLHKRFGITTAELQRAATTFGVFGKAAGVSRDDLGAFTKDLVAAGLDLSSFYNADPTEVFQALRSGLAGEAEPLRQFGIFLSDAAMQAQAATMGLTGDLTESQKVMVRQAIIMKSLGDAQGDLERTSGGLANKWRAIKGRGTELATMIGTALLPYATRLASALDGKLAGALGTVEAKLPGLIGGAEQLGGRIVGMATAVKTAYEGGGLSAAVGQIDTLVGAGGKLNPILDELKSLGADLGAVLTGVLAPAVGDVAGAVDPEWLTPLGAARALLGFVADNTEASRVALTGLIAALSAAKLATLGYNLVLGVKNAQTSIATARTHASTAATWLNTTATTVAHSTLLTWLGVKALELAAWLRSTAATAASTVSMLAYATASGIVRGATLAWTAVQWLLNAALTANPIGLVIAGIALLIGGVVLAYQKVGWFRDAINLAWAGMKIAWQWAKDLGAAVATWIVDKFTLAKAGAQILADKIGSFVDKVKAGIDKVRELGRAIADSPLGKAVGAVGSFLGFGDTTTSRARGRGGLAATMASHAAISAAAGARPTITNALVGGGGRGHGSGDHQAGRALDLKGRGLAAYAKTLRAAGGYAAFHGSGPGRHLHAVPPAMGDTSSSVAGRVRSRTASAVGSGLVIGEGGVTVVVQGGAAGGIDVAAIKAAVREGIEEYAREQLERS